MPVVNNPASVRSAFQEAVKNRIFSRANADSLLEAIEQDGVTRAEVNQVVESLTRALRGDVDLIDLGAETHRTTLNTFLQRLHQKQPLPLLPESSDTATTPVDFVALLRARGAQQPSDLIQLSIQSLANRSVSLSATGDIVVGDRRPVLDLQAPNDTLLEALWAVNRPGQALTTAPESRRALANRLGVQIRLALADDADTASGNYHRHQAVTAALGALSQLSGCWDDTVAAELLAAKTMCRTPLQAALLKRTLESANNLTDAQKAEIAAITLPEGAADVLSAYDDAAAGRARVGATTVSSAAAQLALAGLCFARDAEAVQNLYEAMVPWRKLESSYARNWSTLALEHMHEELEQYVNDNNQLDYSYGALKADAPAAVASLKSERAVAAVEPGLRAAAPNLKGFALSPEQARYVLSVIKNVRDDAAMDELVRCLAIANATFSETMPSRWGQPPKANEPMLHAAFEIFRDAASHYQQRIDHTDDGKLGYSDLAKDLYESVRQLRSVLQPRLRELLAQPPRWGNVVLSQQAATYLRDLLQTRLRSSMSAENIGRALTVIAKTNQGRIEGPSFELLKAVITDYVANWPDGRVLDFNKLERIATCKVEGRDPPLCTLNGERVELAEFYAKAARTVANAMDITALPQPWVADRWGNRANQALQVLDVVAEQSLRDEGPVAKLREQYSHGPIEIQFTGLDGDHEQFIYVVKGDDGTSIRFNQGSDGTLARYTASNIDPILTATIDAEGALHVQAQQTVRSRRYPLQMSYGVGDKIDFPHVDLEAEERQDKGEEFSTRSRVVEAEILAYTAAGDYAIRYHTPKGQEQKRTVPLRDIRRANNPHWFKLRDDYYSDVTINIDSDAELKKFLDDAQPIIARHLPTNGSVAAMSPEELARRQKACIAELMKYTEKRVIYPTAEDKHPDEKSKRYHELTGQDGRFPLGELTKIGRGVCRHQCILEHLLLQCAGIDSRLASGAANTSSNKFRAYHIWVEVTLANGERFLSDQTWTDPTIPLWEGAYSVDKRRIEMYRRTARYDKNIVLDRNP